MATEKTFPMRPDAYKATDLRPDGDDGKILPPTLPYPGLAARTLASHPTMKNVVSNSSAGGGKAGFFAAIGRKTSMRQKDRGIGAFTPNSQGTPTRPTVKLGLGSSSGSATSNVSSTQPPKPRPVQLENTPTLPGGPRAPPRRTSVLMSSIMTSTPQLFASADTVSTLPVRAGAVNNKAIGTPQRVSMAPPPPQHPSNTSSNMRAIAASRRV